MKPINKHILIIFFYFIITTFALAGFFINCNGKIIGNINHPNAQGEILLTDIMKTSLLHHKILNWSNTNFFNYPYGEQLSDIIRHTVHLYFSGLISIITNSVISYNLTFFIIIILNAYCMFLFAQYLFKNYYLSWLAGLFYTFNVYTLLKVNIGSLHKSSIFFIPLYIMFLLKLFDTKKTIYILITFVCLVFVYLQYPMYALYCLLFSIFFISYRFVKNKKIQELKYFTVISILSVVFLYWLGVLGHITFDLSIYENEPWKLNIFYFIKNYLPYPTSLPIGISPYILILALLGFIYKKEARFFFIVSIFYIVLSFGNYITIAGITIPMPFYFLAKTVKFFSNMQLYAPIRTLPLAYLCLIISAIYFIQIVYSKFGKKSIYLIAGIFILELIFLYPESFPVKTSNLPEYGITAKIKNKNGNVLFLPLFNTNNKILTHKSMLIALMSDKKMANAYDSESWVGYIIRNKDVLSALKDLKDNNIRFIIIYTDLQAETKQESELINLIKAKSSKIDTGTLLYEINENI